MDKRDHTAPQSVTEITTAIRRTLGDSFPQVFVQGEISNFRPSAKGHLYFLVKDDQSVLPCAMFRGNATRLEFDPRDGDQVEIHGGIDVYPPRGAYQLIVRRMVRAGAGRILALLEDRKRRLAAEGLFDRSRPLPRMPRHVAVVTSPTGAAIRDFLQVLRRRGAPTHVRVIPVPVQGADAPSRIAAAVRYADRHRLGDTIVVTRGGGSLEDLLPFSDESVVRAIVGADTPVLSAIGHEIDWALSDFAADARAPTPSAAAEVVAPSAADIRDRIRFHGREIVSRYRDQLNGLRRRAAAVSETELRYRFRNLAQPWYQRVDEATTAITTAIGDRLARRRTRLAVASERVEAASPYLALERGYAIVRSDDGASPGEIVVRAAMTAPGQRLSIQFSDDSISTKRIDDE